jgi:hypothetical protein
MKMPRHDGSYVEKEIGLRDGAFHADFLAGDIMLAGCYENSFL